jgi:hypothetical protein
MKKGFLKKITIIGIAFLSYSIMDISLYSTMSKAQSPPPYEQVLLPAFPVPLDQVFLNNSPSEQSMILGQIRNWHTGAAGYLIAPYPNSFYLDKYPMCAKWYVNCRDYLNVTIPVESYMILGEDWSEQATQIINGTERRMDLGVELYLSHYINLFLGHICVNESLVQDFNSATEIDVFGHNLKAVYIPPNTTIGVSVWMTFDILVYDYYQPNFPNYPGEDGFVYASNPFHYFTETAQNEILSHYQIQYDAMKESGGWIESSLNRTININEEGTLFGTWWYHDWPYELNSSITDSEYKYTFDGSILNIMNVNRTDRDTFFKDVKTDENYTDNMIGVYGDCNGIDVDNYTLVGCRYCYLLQGNTNQGIINLTEFHNNELTGKVYMKFEVIESSTSIYEDLLYVEYFNNLTEAQGPFTSNKITYIRKDEIPPRLSDGNIISGYNWMIILSLISFISIITIIKRRYYS